MNVRQHRIPSSRPTSQYHNLTPAGSGGERGHHDCHSAPPASSFVSTATTLSAPAGGGRCKSQAISQGAFIQVSRDPSLRIKTGVASAWMGATSGLASVVRKLNKR